MAIKAGFTRQDIANRLNQFHDNVEKTIISHLILLGEKSVNLAKNLNTYKDRTGNLRASIGYIVIARGKIVHTFNFKGKGQEGQSIGEAYIRKISGGYTNGYALIVVAGMQYAAAVEAKGYDVLTSAEIFAEKELPKLMIEIKKALNKMKK
ncbi:hypothetical protein [Aquirufa ecclesiirivi]|uniref:hypothetical protein n=1 Tax=Aquirufa ecclesiirivi TaxID=2715124 RepID=UPI003BAF6D77